MNNTKNKNSKKLRVCAYFRRNTMPFGSPYILFITSDRTYPVSGLEGAKRIAKHWNLKLVRED